MSQENSQPQGENPEFIFAQSMAAFQRGDLEKAVKHADRLLKISGHAAPAIAWSVRLRVEAGRWQEALDIGAGTSDSVPGLIGLLGHAYEGLGDLVNTQICFQKAAIEQPDNPNWSFHNASTLSRLFRDFESMESLKKGLALAPNPAGFLQLGEYELTYNDPAAAYAAAKKSGDAGHILAAKSLLALARPDESAREWRLAEAGKNVRNVPLQRAIAEIRHGQFEAGIAGLQEIIAADPKNALAYAQIVAAKRVTEEDRPFLAQMEELAGQHGLLEEEQTALEFGLGKAYDNLKEFDKAMIHFDRANWLQGREIRESGGFDRESYVEDMESRKRIYSAETVASLAKQGNRSETPIFVLGMIRSGTTLAEQILSSHPLVSGAGEQDFWINADARLTDYDHRTLNEAVLRNASEVYQRLLNRFAKQGDTRVVDKQPGNLILAGALHAAFPNARIIYMRRHPVDIAISIWTTHIRTSTRFVNDKSNIAFAFREHDRLREHWRQVIPGDRLMEVSYESLIEDRRAVTERMLEFCGLPWSDECLAPEKNRKQVITPSLWQVRQPVYRTSMERWRNYEPWLGVFRELLP